MAASESEALEAVIPAPMKLFGRVRVLRLAQRLNMFFMFVTFEVLKFERFREVTGQP